MWRRLREAVLCAQQGSYGFGTACTAYFLCLRCHGIRQALYYCDFFHCIAAAKRSHPTAFFGRIVWQENSQPQGKNDSVALGILAVNPGVGALTDQFDYVGYKGGSEPGVLNMTWLLRSKETGKHYAMSGGWNDPEKEVDLGKFKGLMMAAADHIEDDQGATSRP